MTTNVHPVHRPRRQRLTWLGILTLALSLFAPGALAQRIAIEFDHAVDFTKFKTFAIKEGSLRSPSAELNNELVKKRLEAEIEGALSAKGLTKANGPADLNLSYILGSIRRGPAGRVSASGQNFEGNMVLDLRDAGGALVWHCVATEEDTTPTKLSAKLGAIVKKAFAKYPPKK